MLKVHLFEKTSEIYDLDFVQDLELKSLFVFPNPSMADDFRYHLEKNQPLLDKDVLTISRFIKDLYDGQEVLRKAELISQLAWPWKKKVRTPTFEKFFHAFNLLSELRSFSLNLELVEEVLPEFDEELASSVRIFWKIMEQEGLIDEHMAYHNLSQLLLDQSDFGDKKNIFFIGFGHLNNHQIDLLHALSSSHHVYIPFPLRVYLKAHAQDWIKWVDTTLQTKTKASKRDIQGRYVLFPKKKMAEYLRVFLKSKTEKNNNFYLLKKELELEDINEIPLKEVSFKVKSELFKDKLQEVFESFFKIDLPISSEKFLEQLKKLEDAFLQNSDFRGYKIVSLVKDMANPSGPMDHFSLELLKYLCELQLPRNFSIPLARHPKAIIKGVDRAIFFDTDSVNILCVNQSYPALKGSGTKYPEKVENFLMAIGPVQNPLLEYWQVHECMMEILQDKKTIFFIEDGLEMADMAVEELFKEFNPVHRLGVEPFHSYQKEHDFLRKLVEDQSVSPKSLSATKLQSYFDCPRKYYFYYNQDLRSFVKSNLQVSPIELGALEHAVLERYYSPDNNKDLDTLVKELACQQLDLQKLPHHAYKKAVIEVKEYTYQAITELDKLRGIFPHSKFYFEHKLGPYGRVDCLMEDQNLFAILDFKRSEASIPTIKAFINQEIIQLWFYLNHCERPVKNCLFIGYMNLKNPLKSLVYLRDESLIKTFDEQTFLSKKNFKFSEDETYTFSSLNEKYGQWEQEILKKIQTEKFWPPVPRDSKACLYCSFKNICPRMEKI